MKNVPLRFGRKHSAALVLAIIAALFLSTAASATGPGSDYPPPILPEGVTPVTVAYRSIGSYDGWILESSETSNLGGSQNKLATTFNVGDDNRDRQYRSILSFNTGPLPDTAIIAAAQVKIKRQGIVGSDPFATHGLLVLAIRQGAFSGDVALQFSDFSSPRTAGSFQDRFAPMPNSYTWYRCVLRLDNLKYINTLGVSQFRIMFTKDDDDDLIADYVKFFSGNSVVENQPELLLTYWVP